MASGKIIGQSYFIPMQSGNLGTTSIYNFIRDINTPQGIHIKYVQNSPDNPFKGSVATAIIMKPTDNGNYSAVLLFSNGAAKVSAQLNPNATALTWNNL